MKGCGGSNSDLSRPWTDTLCERKISKLVNQDGGTGRKMAGKCGEDTVACHVLEQKHCVSVKSLNWFNKKGGKGEKCGEDTVASHVLGQTHCVNTKVQRKRETVSL